MSGLLGGGPNETMCCVMDRIGNWKANPYQPIGPTFAQPGPSLV